MGQPAISKAFLRYRPGTLERADTNMSDYVRICLSLISIQNVSYISGHEEDRYEEMAKQMKRSITYKENPPACTWDICLQLEDARKVAGTAATRDPVPSQAGPRARRASPSIE